jgi:hypothetical protein
MQGNEKLMVSLQTKTSHNRAVVELWLWKSFVGVEVFDLLDVEHALLVGRSICLSMFGYSKRKK